MSATVGAGSHVPSVQQVLWRITPVSVGMMSTWSRKQQQVFGLVDGNRTFEQAAMLLHQSPEVVEEVLNELQAMGVIQR